MAKKGVEKVVEKAVVKEEPKVEVKEEPKEELTPEQAKEIMSEPIEGYDKKTADNPDFFNEEVIEEEPKEEIKEEEIKEPPEEKKVEAKEETVTPTEKPETPKEDFYDKLERELAKPEGKENLGEFSDREKAYFWQMRRDRRARQKAEEERDILRFEKLKKEQTPEKLKQVEGEPEIFKDRDEEDFITVKDLKALADKINKKETPKGEEQAPVTQDPLRMAYLKMCDREAKAQFSDYEEVLSLSNEIIANSPSYQIKLIDAIKDGENPAVVMYHLIKGDPDFESALEKKVGKKELPPEEEKKEPNPEQVKKVEVAKKAQEKMEVNTQKPKTSGHAGGSETSPELTLEQMMRMSDKEFSKLPKNLREKALRAYGA